MVLLALASPHAERWAVQSTLASLLLLLSAAPLESSVSGTLLSVGGVSLNIVPECTPLMPGVLLSVAMIAYPAARSWKMAGLAAGIAALWIYNLARVLGLMALLMWQRQAFFVVHVYLWGTMTLLVISGLFVLWLGLQRRKWNAT